MRSSGWAVQYYVYLLASRKYGTLYLGVTRDLVRRVYQHETKAVPGFSAQHNVTRLVWFEVYDDPSHRARAREADQEVAAGLEDSVDRRAEPGLG